MRNYTLIILLLPTFLLSQNSFELSIWYLKYHEGYSSTNYLCSSKEKTIGWGVRSSKKKIFPVEARNMLYTHFEKDYQWAKKEYPHLENKQHHAIALLMYQCGSIGKDLDYRIRNNLPVADVWIQYNKAKGKLNESFLIRRIVEIQIYEGINLNYLYNVYKERACKQAEEIRKSQNLHSLR